MRSWDRTQVPKPFSTVALVVGEPMSVPADAKDGDLERWRVELEVRLRALEGKALKLLNVRTFRTSEPVNQTAPNGCELRNFCSGGVVIMAVLG